MFRRIQAEVLSPCGQLESHADKISTIYILWANRQNGTTGGAEKQSTGNADERVHASTPEHLAMTETLPA